MVKNNKIIKDLKERNDKLVNQYRDRDIRCVSLERQLDELKGENQSLRKQLDYLRSGEYLNQLKFEVSMLEDLVENNEVSEEDKRFIDMAYRNTELLEENQELEKQLEVGEEQYNDLVEEKEDLQALYDDANLEIQKYKEVIDKATKWVSDYMDEWDIYDEVWHDLNDLLILLEKVE